MRTQTSVLQPDPKSQHRLRKQEGLTDVPGGMPCEHTFLLNCLLSYMTDATSFEDLRGLDLSKDRLTILERFEKEGFGFISKILPKYSDWFRECVQKGCLSPNPNFKKYRSSSRVYPYPAFLQGLVTILFDGETGSIRPEPVTDEDRQTRRKAFTVISTICNSFGKKYEVPLSDEKKDLQVRGLIAYDRTTFNCQGVLNLSPHYQRVAARARALLARVLEQGKYDPWSHGLAHGTGAVAIPKEPHEKYTAFPGLPLSLQALFARDPDLRSYSRWFESSNPSDERNLESYSFHVGGISRLEMVPKDSLKLRTICCEPVENMIGQQGLRMSLYEMVESHPLTRGYVNFTNQEINRMLARNSSASEAHATLDLSSASDSVTKWHIDMMWPAWFSSWLYAVRSRYTMATVKQFKSGKCESKVDVVFEPNMFAPMGSAVCFPVEALTFWALCKANIEEVKVTQPEFAHCNSDVWVYGDDIILPSELFESTSLMLKQFGMKVNLKKSFYAGPFRESCGFDALYGVDVSPVTRLKSRVPFAGLGTPPDEFCTQVVSWVEYANRFESAGCFQTADRIRRMLNHQIPSSRSYPHLCEELDPGFLYFLDYNSGMTYLQFIESSPTIEEEPTRFYDYRPCFPYEKWNDHPHRLQGELFWTERPYYYGYSRRLWVTESKSYDADLSSDLRYVRYMLERGTSGGTERGATWNTHGIRPVGQASSSGLPGNWFTAKDGFRIVRKRVILT